MLCPPWLDPDDIQAGTALVRPTPQPQADDEKYSPAIDAPLLVRGEWAPGRDIVKRPLSAR
jgi:hypothetical protein